MSDPLRGVSLADALRQHAGRYDGPTEFTTWEQWADVAFAWFAANRDTLQAWTYEGERGFDALLEAARNLGGER